MSRLVLPRIVLDSGPVGLLCHPKRDNTEASDCKRWLLQHLTAGSRIYIPEIIDYEVRRGLILNGNRKVLDRLDLLLGQVNLIPLDSPTLRRAAELWADLRRRHLRTTDNARLDVDVILGAQAEKVTASIVATSNVKHLSRLVNAEEWRNI